MICYDMVQRSASVWSCANCFSIFHLPCIRKWVRAPPSFSDAVDPPASWRCPGCESVHDVRLMQRRTIEQVSRPRLLRDADP